MVLTSRGVTANINRGMPFTGLLNSVPKYVVSRTLTDPLAWQGSTLVTEALAEGITSVKERHDEVHVIGSLNLVQSLLRLGLVDRLRLWLYPLLLGSGKHVFADGTVPTALRPYLPAFRHALVDLATTQDEALSATARLRAFLKALKYGRRPDLPDAQFGPREERAAGVRIVHRGADALRSGEW